MFQTLKYLFLTLSLFSLLNLVRSNNEVKIPLHFEIPLIGDYLTPPIPIFFIFICAFCAGGLLFSFFGALRMSSVSKQKKELKKLQKENQLASADTGLLNAETYESESKKNDLPSLRGY